MTLPPALAQLVTYFEPLSGLRRDFQGAVTLQTPGVNILALNASFVPDADPARLAALLRWHDTQVLPPLLASTVPLPGEAVATLRLGTYHLSAAPRAITVEQVSRLALSTWAAVLTEAYGTPEWAAPLARHLAARLEGDRAYTLLLAYAGGEAVGALLWRADSLGGAAHLWGTLDPAADAPLLNAAFELGGSLRASLPETSPLTVTEAAEVSFRLAPPGHT
ncbi:hypothetical protein [Deinococcus sp. YIM 77859]|uniref:hypothetical protein n=1 Tax=Deinococcus sp. YIM 77859 TaxID=1540221 RepID=UPI0005570E0D|nr:hypothetical protein [Deinococcus sp. YIM 77859]